VRAGVRPIGAQPGDAGARPLLSGRRAACGPHTRHEHSEKRFHRLMIGG